MKNPTWILFKKELLDILRDYKTLLTAIVLPILLFPLIFYVSTKVQTLQKEKEQSKTLKVAVVHTQPVDRFLELLQESDGIEVSEDVSRDELIERVEQGDFDAAFLFSKDFNESVESREKTGYVNLYFKLNVMDPDQSRLTEVYDTYRQELVDRRYERLEVNESMLKVVQLGKRNVSSMREFFGKLMGGFLPYIFLMVSYVGCLTPAMDLGAGEKERGTLETLLVTPASRMQILMGKFLVVALFGFAAGFFSILSCIVSLQFFADEMPRRLMKMVLEIVSPQTLLLVGSLLIPICILLAAVMLMISIYCRSFKESQSYISPLMLLILFPAIVAMIPGFDLNTATACIPIFNISLATKAIIAGTAEPLHLVICYASMIFWAGLALLAARSWFNKESVLFRD